LWGEQTQRSLEHFSIGQDLMPREMITAYAILKKAAANANRADGRLDNRPTNRCCQLAGTALGGKTPVHPDDHVNMSLNAGLVLSLAGFFAVLAMPIVGRLLGRGTDARWLIGAGLLLMTAGNYWMSQLNLDIGPVQVIWPRVVLVAGLAVCFAPANVAAYLYTPMALRGAAVGLLSLLRNEGGSVGASLAQTFQERRDQFHTLRLVEYLDPSMRRPIPFSRTQEVSSFSKPRIPSRRGNSPGRNSKTCVSSRRRRWPISTAFGLSPC
jgi:hypothetical protein